MDSNHSYLEKLDNKINVPHSPIRTTTPLTKKSKNCVKEHKA